MAKTFKKNQKIVATLPTGRKVEGTYIEPYGTDGHSIYVLEYDGQGADGEPMYRRCRYGVKEDFIDAKPKSDSDASISQYKAWLKRATILDERIEEYENDMKKAIDDGDTKTADRLEKKITRTKEKLSEIDKKIEEYENGTNTDGDNN